MDDAVAGTSTRVSQSFSATLALSDNMSMLSQEAVLRLIGRIYDAATDRRLWPMFLEDFADAVNGTLTALIYHDLQADSPGLMMSVRCDPECAKQYIAHFSALDPYKKVGLALHRRAGAETVYIGEELVAPARLTRTEFYNEFSVPHAVVHQFGTPIAITKSWVANISSHRPGNCDPFGAEEVTLLRALLPHLRRAILFHHKLAKLEDFQRASLDAIDLLSIGVVMLARTGKIVSMNREATLLVAQNDGLCADNHGLRTASSSLNQKLRAAVAGASLTANGEGLGTGGLLAVSRPSGKRPFHLVVAPVGRNGWSARFQNPSVVVFITDPERLPETLSDGLARTFKFTAAEARLADLLSRGETLVRAAEILGIKHNTARTHLQRIYDKTGTRHQGHLVRLLVAGMPPIAMCEKTENRPKQRS